MLTLLLIALSDDGPIFLSADAKYELPTRSKRHCFAAWLLFFCRQTARVLQKTHPHFSFQYSLHQMLGVPFLKIKTFKVAFADKTNQCCRDEKPHVSSNKRVSTRCFKMASVSNW